ncbi:MAG: hypothetical protein ACYSO3_07220, partial [Planctomycetota bacterium]
TPTDGEVFPSIQVESYPAERQEWLRKYFGQTTYIDNKILDIIDHIRNHSKRPPVIIVQGDHGLRDRIEQKTGKFYVPQEAFPEMFSILNAYYLPGCDYSQFHEGISPVNTFRVLFNHYFGTNLDILPDKCYFSYTKKEAGGIYAFQDVTGQVEPPKSQSPAELPANTIKDAALTPGPK